MGRRGRSRQKTRKFSGIIGPQDNYNDLPKALHIIEQFFDKKIVEKIVIENNCYAE